MKLLHKLLAPVALLTATMLALLVLSLWFAEKARLDQEMIAAADAQIIQVGEIRSLSRALQRDTLNLIFDPDPTEKTNIAGSVQRRTQEVTRRLEAVVSIASDAERPKMREIQSLQTEALASLAAVQKLAIAGDAAQAHALFRDDLRRKERAASRVTDGFMDERAKAAEALKQGVEQSRKGMVWLQSALGVASALLAAGIAVAVVVLGVTRPPGRSDRRFDRARPGPWSMSPCPKETAKTRLARSSTRCAYFATTPRLCVAWRRSSLSRRSRRLRL